MIGERNVSWKDGDQTLAQNKLVITGMGALTPIGLDVPSYWKALTAGVCGVGPITRFDASGLPVQIAAELKGF